MTLRADPPAAAGRHSIGLFAAFRALVAVPAVTGSVLLMLVLFAWMGRWEGPVLLIWLAGSVAVMTRVGERTVVRVGCGFRRPNPVQAARLNPLWSQALRRCGIDAHAIDLYLKRSRELNAFAVGARSVVVTTGLLTESRAGPLTDDHLVSVLVHELGHHVTRQNRYGLLMAWLAAPWRFAVRVAFGIALALARRQPSRWLAAVIATGVIVAIAQAVLAGDWNVVLVLTGLTVGAVLCPVIDAALSRRSEFAADRYATAAGVAPELASSLQILDSGHLDRPGLVSQLLSRHPTTLRRIAELSTPP
jgi:Zn-dependent protease with chaperone function